MPSMTIKGCGAGDIVPRLVGAGKGLSSAIAGTVRTDEKQIVRKARRHIAYPVSSNRCIAAGEKETVRISNGRQASYVPQPSAESVSEGRRIITSLLFPLGMTDVQIGGCGFIYSVTCESTICLKFPNCASLSIVNLSIWNVSDNLLHIKFNAANGI